MADEFDPSAVSSDYAAQAPFWNMVSAILGGEAKIKAGREAYLPKFAKETKEKYDYRLSVSPFTNIYGDISKNLASKPFSKEIEMKEGSPARYEALAENIDGQGHNLQVFAAECFKSAMDKAIDWILVDYTRAAPRADGRPLTLADEREQGLRPYWVRVPAENLIACYSAFIGGIETIYHARIRECSVEVGDDLKETSVERIRILDRGTIKDALGNIVGLSDATWALWERRANADGKAAWVLVDSGAITIKVIPLVPVILTKRIGGSWQAEPPLRDLAHMQITEYRQESNLEWIKVMTCFPMVCVSGMATTDNEGKPVEVTVGPNVVFLIPQNTAGTGPAGTVEIVEPGAQAIKENREQLELTRKEMRDLGMQPLTAANLTVVTTANVSKKASSAVQAWAFLFKDALEQAWRFTAMWLGEKVEPEVVVHTDFAVELEGENAFADVLTGARDGVWSKQTAFEEAKRRNRIVTDRDFEKEQELVAGEREGLDGEEEIDPRTGEPIREPEPAA